MASRFAEIRKINGKIILRNTLGEFYIYCGANTNSSLNVDRVLGERIIAYQREAAPEEVALNLWEGANINFPFNCYSTLAKYLRKSLLGDLKENANTREDCNYWDPGF